jgi:uncharacterized protein (TIGR02996 family)
MPRYEFTEGSSNKFWDITLAGKSFTTTYGRIGANGQTTIKSFKSDAEAKSAYEKLVAEKVKKGYALAGGEKPKAKGKAAPAEKPATIAPRSNAALEKAIVANPTDADAYMVYADWLQGEGDPRGELVAMQAGGKTAAAKKLLEQHADYFYGALKDHLVCHDGGDTPAFTWKNGFIHAVRLAHNCYGDSEWKGKLAEDVLKPLLAHPSGKFVVEMTLNENDDPTDDTLDDIFAVIAKHPLPTLRKLRIGDDVSQISWYRVGNLGKIWKAIPNLTHFQIEAGEFELGKIDLPHLVDARFVTGGLSKSAAKSIANAAWPKIEYLEVYYGDPQYGADASAKDVAPLLARTDMPKLKHLGVKNAEFQDELVEYLAKSKLVKQVATLDISMGLLSDECMPAFEKHADAFAHLALDVSETYLSKDAQKRLKKIVKKLVADGMRDPNDDYRYVCVGE